MLEKTTYTAVAVWLGVCAYGCPGSDEGAPPTLTVDAAWELACTEEFGGRRLEEVVECDSPPRHELSGEIERDGGDGAHARCDVLAVVP